MSFVIATPEALAAAVTEISGIGSSLNAANAAAAGPTTKILAAGADEISAAVASLFGGHALDYQSLSARVAAYQSQFIGALSAGAQRYSASEVANGDLLRGVAERLLGIQIGGGAGQERAASAEATGTTTAKTGAATTAAATTTAAAATSSATTSPGSATGTGVSATYASTSQWNSGFVANYTITNTGSTPLTNWQLQFNLPTGASVANLWNGPCCLTSRCARTLIR